MTKVQAFYGLGVDYRENEVCPLHPNEAPHSFVACHLNTRTLQYINRGNINPNYSSILSVQSLNIQEWPVVDTIKKKKEVLGESAVSEA